MKNGYIRFERLPPDPSNLPEGCAFYPRCPYAMENCKKEPIDMYWTPDGHQCRCCHIDNIEKGEYGVAASN